MVISDIEINIQCRYEKHLGNKIKYFDITAIIDILLGVINREYFKL